MVRAIARQAEAERERRAKIINAEGEQQAAQKLVEAARILAPSAAGDAAALSRHAVRHRQRRSSTIVFPFPIDLMQAFSGMASAGRIEWAAAAPEANRARCCNRFAKGF